MNTLIAAPRLVLDQITGHHNLVKLTHTINCLTGGLMIVTVLFVALRWPGITVYPSLGAKCFLPVILFNLLKPSSLFER